MGFYKLTLSQTNGRTEIGRVRVSPEDWAAWFLIAICFLARVANLDWIGVRPFRSAERIAGVCGVVGRRISVAGGQLYDIVAGTFYVQTQRIGPNQTKLFIVAGPSEFSPSFQLTLTDEQLDALGKIVRAALAVPDEPRQNAA